MTTSTFLEHATDANILKVAHQRSDGYPSINNSIGDLTGWPASSNGQPDASTSDARALHLLGHHQMHGGFQAAGWRAASHAATCSVRFLSPRFSHVDGTFQCKGIIEHDEAYENMPVGDPREWSSRSSRSRT